jgi:hypothetical protein
MQLKVINHNIALGLSNSKPAKVRECLSWALQHDEHPAVRVEAIRAVSKLGLIQEDAIKNSVLTLLTTDTSEKVRKESEKSLSQFSVVSKGMVADSRELIVTVDGKAVNPFPHLLDEETKEQAQIFLRNSLVNDQEVVSVIDQVRSLSTKEAVFHQVEEKSAKTNQVRVQGLDLDYDASFRPRLQEIHQLKSKKKYMNEIVYNQDGIPEFKTQ